VSFPVCVSWGHGDMGTSADVPEPRSGMFPASVPSHVVIDC
jgi:hypothetical protein